MMPRVSLRSLASLSFLLALAACGGGGGGQITVSTMGASNLRYGSTSTITISGANLLQGVTVTVEGACETVVPVRTVSDDRLDFTCDVRNVGHFKATAKAADGRVVAQLTSEVPVPQVSVATSRGTFLLELDPIKAPITTREFLAYVNLSFYSSMIFHNVITTRGIQTGVYNTGLAVKTNTRAQITNESNNGLKNIRGTVGILRGTGLQASWYVNTGNNTDLDFVDSSNPGFTVFGSVLSGMDVVDTISRVETRPDLLTGLASVPVVEVSILSAVQVR